MCINPPLRNGELVEIAPQAKLPTTFKYGKVVGIFTQPLAPETGCIYAVDVGLPVNDDYPYSVVGILECHLTPILRNSITELDAHLTPEAEEKWRLHRLQTGEDKP